MSFWDTSHFPTRIQEEIHIFNTSLPMKPVCRGNEEYEPEFGELLRTVECPVCRSTPNPPIYNCVNGHFSCATCFPRLPLQKCPYCLAKFTKMRNYPLENLVTANVFICDFRHLGCKARDMSMIKYEEHMKNCLFHSSAVPINKPETQSTLQNLPNNGAPFPAAADLNEHSCPRCNFMNSKRKVKCQNCEINLRAPTPMCSRPPWVMGVNNTRGSFSTDSL